MYSSSSPYARVRYSHEGKGGTLKFVSRCLLVCSAYLTGRVRRSLSYTERAIIKAVVHDMKKRSTHFLKLELRVPVLACWSRGYYRRNGLHTSRALSCVYRYSPAGQGVITDKALGSLHPSYHGRTKKVTTSCHPNENKLQHPRLD